MTWITAIVWVTVLFLLYKLFDRLVRRPRVGHYAERYIFITGCDSGFGRTSALRLDALGCHVIAGCLTEEGESGLKKFGTCRLQTVRLDVSKPESVRQAFEFVRQILPPGLWGLVNNAGVSGTRGRLEWLYLEDYKSTNSINLYGLIDVTMTFLPLIKKERGRIVNTSSMAGRVVLPDAVPYSISKYGVEAFSDVLRRSIANYGCKVSIVEPGGFKTNINTPEATRQGIMSTWSKAPQAAKEEFGEKFLQSTIEAVIKVKLDEDLGEVVEAYEGGLFCRYPRARYVVGSQGRLGAFLPPLPEWLADFVFEKFRRGPSVLPAALLKDKIQ